MRHCFPLAIALLMALLLATPIVAQGPLINEIRIDQSGGDDDEYFELIGMPGASLDGFTYLVIGDGSGSGTSRLAGGAGGRWSWRRQRRLTWTLFGAWPPNQRRKTCSHLCLTCGGTALGGRLTPLLTTWTPR